MFSEWKMFCLGYLVRSHTKLALYIVGYEAGLFWPEINYVLWEQKINYEIYMYTVCKVILY